MASLTRAAGVLFVTVLLGTFAFAVPAQAHAKLIGTTPAAGQAVTTAPSTVKLDFNGNVISIGLQFQVIGPSGLAMQGKPVVNRGTVTQPLMTGLVNGTYVVNWHVVHDDGHPDSGTFSFAVQVAGGPIATGPPVTVPAINIASEPEDQPRLPPFWAALGVVVVAVVVVMAVIIDRRRTGH